MSGRGGKGRNGTGAPDLLADLRRQVTALERDLRVRAEDPGGEFAARLKAEYARAIDAERTAATYETWIDDRVTQAAVAWVLSCVFVRFAEDNELIGWPFIAGPGERLAIAEERHAEFFREHPNLNDRDWLIAAFEHVAEQSKAAAGLFDHNHNPLWALTPSFEAATTLIAFWRRRGSDGEVVHRFAREDWDTRFLGDLYQDLSEHARKTYALLQTPVFVEEFILDLTLEPAVEDFGLEGLRAIDPACGSGHFLLGIFQRLLDKWQTAESGTDRAELVRRALASVHGCDKNPFAVAIARFRLHVAALKAAGASRLADDHGFAPQIAVADSLWHGASEGRQEQLTMDGSDNDERPFTYGYEDIYEFPGLLSKNTYHVVVANPPYIPVEDKAENVAYRQAFRDVCSGTYALSVPFAALLFELALLGDRRGGLAGYVGQITANSFMKREFGKKLIEGFFANKVELTHILDSSGAYIPGHNRQGTPTVILVGRNQIPDQARPIRVVFGISGELGTPDDPARAPVWAAIVDQVDMPGSRSAWVSAEDAERKRFSRHPWSIGGGGVGDLLRYLNSPTNRPLAELIGEIGRTTHTGLDEAYYLSRSAARTLRIAGSCVDVVLGKDIRDYALEVPIVAFFPYDTNGVARDLMAHDRVFLWPNRTALRERVDFGETPEDRGLRWFDHSMFFPRRYRAPMVIAFAFKASHNHFVLDRHGKLFKQTAPAIKLPDGASEEDYLKLLGVLNSSTVCFWLRDSAQHQGGGAAAHPWSWTYEFSGAIVERLPLPENLSLEYGRQFDSLARKLAAQEPADLCASRTPARIALDAGRNAWSSIRAKMIAVQEELDWSVYGSYNLLSAKDVAATTVGNLDEVPEVNLGERAFEIVLARSGADTQWFARHGSTPITEIPAHWPDSYKRIVQARIDLLESRKDLALIERPECKRRWATTPWEKREAEALRTWLLDRCENDELWYAMRDGFRQPRTLTVNQLADRLRSDDDVVSVAALYARHLGTSDLPLERVLEKILATEFVPYLARLRYKADGLRKRAQWERVWEQQREEDRTGKRLDIKVPPKYTSADFAKTSYWSHRGKLDVPKERFIGYPQAAPDGDTSMLLGWAGWDHKDQAQALVNLVNNRVTQAGWTGERVAALLDGLAELMPWLRQWYGEYDPEWGSAPADDFGGFLNDQRAKLGVGE